MCMQTASHFVHSASHFSQVPTSSLSCCTASPWVQGGLSHAMMLSVSPSPHHRYCRPEAGTSWRRPRSKQKFPPLPRSSPRLTHIVTPAHLLADARKPYKSPVCDTARYLAESRQARLPFPKGVFYPFQRGRENVISR